MWLNSKIAPNRRHNVFKTNRKNIPTNMFKDNDRDGVYNVFDCQPNNKNKQGLIDSALKVVRRTFDSTHQAINQRQPNKSYEYKRTKKFYKKQMENPDLTKDQVERIKYKIYKAGKTRATKKAKFRTAVIEQLVPAQSLTSYGSGDKTVAGIPGRGRGRPRGSVAKKYAAYGGVYGYRRFVSEQKAKLREQLRQAKIQTPSQQQLPEELRGQGIEAQYQTEPQQAPPQQYQEPPQQYQEPPQQVQQQAPQQQYQAPPPQYQQQYQAPQQREIVSPFKSSGGHPYPPVNRQKLQSSMQTVPYGYVESVDAFTGRRFMKKLPQKENWS